MVKHSVKPRCLLGAVFRGDSSQRHSVCTTKNCSGLRAAVSGFWAVGCTAATIVRLGISHNDVCRLKPCEWL